MGVKLLKTHLLYELALSLLKLENNGKNIELPNHNIKRIYIYGAGAVGVNLGKKLIENGVDVLGFIDRNGNGNKINGIIRYNANEVDVEFLEKSDAVVVTVAGEFKEIESFLLEIKPDLQVYPMEHLIVSSEKDDLYEQLNSETIDVIEKILIEKEVTCIKNIVVSCTVYNLLLCFLILKDTTNTLFLMEGDLVGEVATNLKNRGCLVISRENDSFDTLVKLIGEYRSADNCQVLGQDYLSYSNYFLGEGFAFVEDASGWTREKANNISRILSFPVQKPNNIRIAPGEIYEVEEVFKSRNFLPCGIDDSTTWCYITEATDKSAYFDKRIGIIDIEHEWMELDASKKQFFLEIFGIDKEFSEKLKELDGILFLTNSLHSVNLMNIDEEISLYKRILSNYPMNRVVIKPHPSDDIDYREIFPESYILPAKIPMELLLLIGCEIDTIVTTVSSAAFFKGINCKKDRYDLKGNLLQG